MQRQYRSEALGAIHETMNALYELGTITKVTMCEFDEMCRDPVVELQPEEIRALREREVAALVLRGGRRKGP